MLDLMRSAQRRRWFTVGIIMFVVLSFVLAIFAIWGGAASGRTSISSGAWVVKIDGEPISAKDFDRRRSQIENRLRDRLGSDFEVQTSGLDFHQMALFQLMGQALAYNEATRLGMSATDGEIAQAVVTSPTFQRGGKFIGREAYENELRRNGFDVAEYEAQIARDLTSEKLRDLMGTLVDVTDAEVEKAFTEEGESAEVDYILFKSADFSQSGEPTAKEVEAYYRDHSRKYLTPERRSADVIVIERDPLLATIDVPEADIAAEYEKNKSTRFTGGEQRRASHILFKVAQNAPQADQDAAKAKADAVLAEAKAGKDFAELARSTSQDSSGPAGGDLGWFERGRMVPEFDSAVFSLAEGQISDVIRTQFGFHIIKVTGSRPAGVRPLEDVRAQIKQGLSFQKVQEALRAKSDALSAKLSQQASGFEAIAAELGYTVKHVGPIAQDEPLGELGSIPQAAEEIFRLKPGEHSAAIASPQGILFVQVKDVVPPAPAPLDTVKTRVAEDLKTSRAQEKARAATRDILAAGAEGFKAAADKKKLEVKSTVTFTRATAPDAFNDTIKDAIFSHRANDLLGPLDAPDGVAVVKVIKREPQTPEEKDRIKGVLREQLLERKKDYAYQSLLNRLQQSAAIEYDKTFLSVMAQKLR